MKLAFYIAKYGNWIDKAIAYRTGPGKYSHVELVFDNGESFSSSAPDGGVRFKKIDFNPEKWDFIDVPDADGEVIRAFASTQVGKKYDYLGIMKFLLPGIIDRSDRWFCSEICTVCLQKCGMLKGVEAMKTSPQTLHDLMLFRKV